VCKGFAIGRTIFGRPAEAWFKGEIKDQQAIEHMAATYRRMIESWERACATAGREEGGSAPR
jgi:5-dehydro-2-deoxygluconokinase